jgi:FkbM family methyltransferase
MPPMSRKLQWRQHRLARRAADLVRPVWWHARTTWTLLRRSPDRMATARLIARLWWRERRGGDERAELLRFRDDGDVVTLWVGEFTDLHVVREAFGDEIYGVPRDIRPRAILDLGANIGVSVLWFHRRYPEAEIHAVEPDRRSLAKLQRNIGHLPQVTVHHAAVAGEDGERTFYESRRGWSSSLTAEATDRGRATTVKAVTIPALLKERLGRDRVDILKMDVEGAEWEILPRLRLADLADVVAGELHPGLLGDDAAEREALRHGFGGLDVSYSRREGVGNFLAVKRPGAVTPHGPGAGAA